MISLLSPTSHYGNIFILDRRETEGWHVSEPFNEELVKLQDVLHYVNEERQRLEKISRYTGDNITEQALEDMRERRRNSLKLSGEEPYFARLDFQEETQNKPAPLYIGKVGLDDGGRDPLIIDWRAPVASLFYSFTGGEDPAEYVAPEGLIEGIIHLKRNLVIRKRQLQRVVDAYVKGEADLSTIDEFLLYRLSERKSDKLQDIVSTIQSEQNDIIRAPKNAALIIQGVAGSGKTTIALHRMAYLMYEHQDSLSPDRMIIFAPNRLFLDYIANVLPELGVGGIMQTTFNDWALDLLEERLEVHEVSESNNQHLEAHHSESDFKGSLLFRNHIENAIKNYETTMIPEQRFEPWEGTFIDPKIIHEWFYHDYQSYPLTKRVERIETRLKTWLDGELKTIEERHTLKELKQKARQKLRAYLKKWGSLSPIDFYRKIIHPDSGVVPSPIANTTSIRLKNNVITHHDLPALVLIHQYFHGIEKDQRFHHTVVDEAQDFTPFHISVLKDATRNDSFTILGDLSQGISEEGGIHSWDAFKQVFPEEKVHYFQLTKSYRSTVEIIEFANRVLSAGYPPLVLAEPVFRSGKDVEVYDVGNDKQIQRLKDEIKKLQTAGHANIGIIARDSNKCHKVHQALWDKGLKPSLLSGKQDKYDGGLSVLPVTLSKGLEFEAVVLYDVNADSYPMDPYHAKLLYVGCTRALHELIVMYTGNPSPLLP
jgi:DNA helicase II / ATP-dependent DNA helicase PcrA